MLRTHRDEALAHIRANGGLTELHPEPPGSWPLVRPEITRGDGAR